MIRELSNKYKHGVRIYDGRVTDEHIRIADKMIDIIHPDRREKEDAERRCIVFADHFEISTRTALDYVFYCFKAETADGYRDWPVFYHTDGDLRDR